MMPFGRRPLYGAHQIEFNGRGVALQLTHFQSADAVLGAEAATEVADQVMNDALDRASRARKVSRERRVAGSG